MSRSGYWQAVMTLKSTPPDLSDQLRSSSDRYIECDVLDRRRLKYFDMFWAVKNVVQVTRPDVIVCWPTGFANWICGGARAGGCKRLLVHSGNPATGGFHGNLMTRYVMLPLGMLGAKVVCCSDYVRDSIEAVSLVPKGIATTVYNCAAVERFTSAESLNRASLIGMSNDTVSANAIMVATMEAHKDHETLLRACVLVREQYPNFRLRLVGDGSLRRSLEALSKCLGLDGCVEFLGTRHDVPDLLVSSDLFVFSTTRQEGLGSVLLEALSAGLPVIASDVPACRELLQNGKWGDLIPAANSELLAKGILHRLATPTTIDMVKKGSEYASSFTPIKMMNQYLSIVGLA